MGGDGLILFFDLTTSIVPSFLLLCVLLHGTLINLLLIFQYCPLHSITILRSGGPEFGTKYGFLRTYFSMVPTKMTNHGQELESV